MPAGSEIVNKVILLEGWALALTMVCIFGHALWVRWYETYSRPRLSRARESLTQILDADEAFERKQTPRVGASIEALSSLPRRLQIRLFLSLARNLSGHQKKAVGDLAVRVGLLARAERNLQSPRWWRRLHAARLLTVLDVGDRAIPRLLTDRHALVRAQGAEWAGEHPGPELIKALLKLLHDSAKFCRFTAQGSLLRMEALPVPLISEYILQASGPALEAALEVALGLAESRLLGPALRLCDDPAPTVQALAARLLGQIGGKDGLTALSKLLGHPEAMVRAAACRALGKLGEWPSAPALARALRDPAWDVRRAAGLGLRSLGSPGILLLRRAVSDEDRFARDMARQVLEIPASTLVRAVS
jgi:hypothetical protein